MVLGTSAIAKSDLDKVTFGEGCVVCVEAVLRGQISFGNNCIVHPKASIIADNGPIIFGDGCVVEENVIITNSYEQKVVSIGSNNLFEIGSEFYGVSMGDNNVLQVKAVVYVDVIVGNNCVVGCKNVVNNGNVVDGTTIYGSQGHTRIINDKPMSLGSQIDILSKVLPQFHYLHSKS